MTGNMNNGRMNKYQKNKGLVLWFTGLPCSGKTTISKKLEKYFKQNSKPVQRLDGDIIRKTISEDLGFSKQDRDKNIKRISYIARILSDNGINVIVAFVSPYQKMRKFARKICPNFIEIYLKCDIEECKRRDMKGMYAKAESGELKNFTGVDDPYEKPKNPDVILETDKYSAKENINKIIRFVKEYGKK